MGDSHFPGLVHELLVESPYQFQGQSLVLQSSADLEELVVGSTANTGIHTAWVEALADLYCSNFFLYLCHLCPLYHLCYQPLQMVVHQTESDFL